VSDRAPLPLRWAGAVIFGPVWRLLIAAGVLCAVASCSSGSPDRSQAQPRGSATATASASAGKALKAAVYAYSDAYVGDEADAAYALLSQRCQDTVARAALRSEINGAAPQLRGQSIKTFKIDSLNGNTATVTYTYSDASINQTEQRWVFESGAWRYDGC